MRRHSLTLFAVLALWIVGDHATLAQQQAIDNCGPLYRRDVAETARVREEKKARPRQQGMPERYLYLLDKEECPACVIKASDAFHIMIVYHDDASAPPTQSGGRISRHTFEWDPLSEREAREALAAGTIKSFHIFNTAVRCNCCPEVNELGRTPDTFADWNPELGVNNSHVISFDDKSDLEERGSSRSAGPASDQVAATPACSMPRAGRPPRPSSIPSASTLPPAR